MGDDEKFNFDWKYLVNSGLSVKDFIPSDLAKKALKLDTHKALRMEEMRPFVMV